MVYLFSSGYSAVEIVVLTVAFALSAIIAIVFHEWAHAFVAYKQGDSTTKAYHRLSLNPFNHLDILGFISFFIIGFGWAKPVQINPLNFKNYKKGMVLVSLAGVITNFILAFVFAGFYMLSILILKGSNMLVLFLQQFLYYCVNINICLLIFNLIPIYPLDGFNAISACFKKENKFYKFMIQYGSLILLTLIILMSFTPLEWIISYPAYYLKYALFSFWGLMF